MASAAGIRAGAAYVELFVQDNRLTRGLAAAAAKLKAFGAGITGLGTQLLGIGVALATPFALAAKLFADMGSELVDMSQRTGVSVEALSELASQPSSRARTWKRSKRACARCRSSSSRPRMVRSRRATP